ncbi:MAG TPA: hypothetical protein VF796_05070 [Humisphaera sp.]
MTEAEWLTNIDPRQKLDFLRTKATERKLRLFGVGCCRQLGEAVSITADALNAVECYADTGKTKAALKRVRQGVKEARHGIPNGDKSRHIEWVALWLAEVAASENVSAGVGDELVRLASLGLVGRDVQSSLEPLTRCVFANPFRPTAPDADWLTPAVVSLAQSTYDERRFDRMPELADALEKAGCDNAEVLSHCRNSGPHVRGCWVVDLVLGKS